MSGRSREIQAEVAASEREFLEHEGLRPELVCEQVGHEWADAGGGLQVCVCCEAERWEP